MTAEKDELLWDGFDDVDWDEVGAEAKKEELCISFGRVEKRKCRGSAARRGHGA